LVHAPLDREGWANLGAIDKELSYMPERALAHRLGPIYNIRIIDHFSPMQNISLLILLMTTFSFFKL